MAIFFTKLYGLLFLAMLLQVPWNSTLSAEIVFSAEQAVNHYAATDLSTAGDHAPKIKTDGVGTWVAVWYSQHNLNGTVGVDRDIFVSKSNDNGVTWSETTLLNTTGTTDGNNEEYAPNITTDGKGNWVVVWQAADGIGTTGDDTEILAATSVDNAATWSQPIALSSTASIDGSATDTSPNISTDRSGNWLAVWVSDFNLGGTAGTDVDIFSARSIDNGMSWSDVVLVNSTATSDISDGSALDQAPIVTTDEAGNWIAVWESTNHLGNTVGTDTDILFARSTDNGATWSDASALNTNASTDGTNGDRAPKIVSDTSGTWVALWHTYEFINSPSNYEIVYSRSEDLGQTWSAPANVKANLPSDGGREDRDAVVSTDGNGNWVATWRYTDGLGTFPPSNTKQDIYATFSRDDATTWEPAFFVNTIPANNGSRNAQSPDIAMNEHGEGIIIFQSNYDLSSLTRADLDIHSRAFFISSPEGEASAEGAREGAGEGGLEGITDGEGNIEADGEGEVEGTSDGEGSTEAEDEGAVDEGEFEGVNEGEVDPEAEIHDETTITLARAIDSVNGAYTAGAELDIVATFSKVGSTNPAPLTLTENLPNGWAYVGKIGGPNPTIKPEVGEQGALLFQWNAPIDFPFNFIYRVFVPAVTTGTAQLIGSAVYGINGDVRTTNDLLTNIPFGGSFLQEGEGLIEGDNEGTIEGDANIEGDVDGIIEGAQEGRFEEEGGENEERHSLDFDNDQVISFTELLRNIQLYNAASFSCSDNSVITEDGFVAGEGNTLCLPHSGDYLPQDWMFSISELLRLIQFYNIGTLHPCAVSEDGFCPGPTS